MLAERRRRSPCRTRYEANEGDERATLLLRSWRIVVALADFDVRFLGLETECICMLAVFRPSLAAVRLFVTGRIDPFRNAERIVRGHTEDMVGGGHLY